MNHLKQLILTLFSLAYTNVFSQTTMPDNLKNEFSISTTSLTLNNLSLRYYRSIDQNLWFKIGLINLSGGNRKTNPDSPLNYPTENKYFNGGLSMGLEKRKFINDKLELTLGADLQATYNYINIYTNNPNISEDRRIDKDKKFMPGLGFTIGGYCHFNDHFSLGFEISPRVLYYSEDYKSYLNNNNYKTSGFDYSFSSNNILFEIKYFW